MVDRARDVRVLTPSDVVLLDVLNDHATVTLADLADELAAAETGVPVESISAEAVADRYDALYHREIPALARAGLLAYDEDADLVSRPGYGADADALSLHSP